MTGIVDVGGGTRGIYGCGVLDRCLDLGISFDFAVGVSAGSANMVSFLAGQKGRNYPFYHDYAFRPEYMSMRNFLHTGSFIGLDYIYGTLSNADGENPLDFDALQRSPTTLEIVTTDARTGKSIYFRKTDMRQDDYAAIKASSCVPAVCQPYVIDGVPYFDGGVSDPIPFERAFRAGCDKVVVILTKPIDAMPGRQNPLLASLLLRRTYPSAAAATAGYPARYADSLYKAQKLADEGRLLLIAPDSIRGMGTLTRDKESLHTLYRKGYADAEQIPAFL